MDIKYSKCRLCHKILGRKDKSSLIDDEVEYQFTNLTNKRLRLKSYWEIICVICLHSLQLASEFKDQMIENEMRYRKENPAFIESDGGEESNDPESEPVERPHPLPKKRKNKKQQDKNEQTVKKLKLIPEKKQKMLQTPDKVVPDTNNNEDVEPIVPVVTVSISNQSSEEIKVDIDKDESVVNPTLDENGNEIEEKSSKTSVDLKFKCFHCDNAYPKKKARTYHILIHHMKQRYKCVLDNCNTIMIRRYNIIKHIKNRHAHSLTNKQLGRLVEKAKQADPVYENPNLRYE